MEREKYIRVPKNKQAMEDYDYGIQKEEQMEEMVLSEKQYSKLDEIGVFDIINEKCDIIIDEYEEEESHTGKADELIEALDALEDASETIEDVLED